MTEQHMKTLATLAGAVSIELGDIYEVVDDSDIVDSAGKYLKFVHISSIIPDQIHMFWLMREENAFDDGCYIVFTDIKETDIWQDLVRIYQGTKFGSLFLMQYRSSAKPKPCPSQKGLYMK